MPAQARAHDNNDDDVHELEMALLQCQNPGTTISSYISMLRSCSKRKDPFRARQIQSHLLRNPTVYALLTTAATTTSAGGGGGGGGGAGAFLADYLVMTLAKCGAVDDAHQLTSITAASLTVFSWTSLISAYADLGRGQEALHTYECMQREGTTPDKFTFVSLFKACASIRSLCQGKQLHAYVCSNENLSSNTYIGNTVVSMYGKCGALKDAECAFQALPCRDTVSWNGMLSAYIEHGQNEKALCLYRQMQGEGMSPDGATFVIVFQACGQLAELQQEEEDASSNAISRRILRNVQEIGHALHSDAHRCKLTSNVLVGTAILCMYSKYGALPEAEIMFSKLVHLDTVAWNAMLSAYIEMEQGDKALSLYGYMQKQGTSPDHLTFVIALQACGSIGEKQQAFQKGEAYFLDIGRALHLDIKRKGYASHVPIANTLMSMYGKCGSIEEAEDVFNTLGDRDIISWNAMLSACNEQGQGDKTLWLYREMQQEQLVLNEITLMCVLQACSERGNLAICEKVHFDIVANNMGKISPLISTLINAYGSCARTIDADSVFDECVNLTFVTWNACIASHVGDGNSFASLYMFERSKLTGIMPDSITFTSVLSACSHNSLVVEGISYFTSMIIDDRERTHFNIMIDLLGRAGDFKKIQSILKRMPMQPDLTVWLCRSRSSPSHGKLELAEVAFENAVRMHPEQSTAYVLMSNIYVDAQLPHSVIDAIKKNQGCVLSCAQVEEMASFMWAMLKVWSENKVLKLLKVFLCQDLQPVQNARKSFMETPQEEYLFRLYEMRVRGYGSHWTTLKEWSSHEALSRKL